MLISCKCSLAPILQYINIKVLEGHKSVDVSQFSELLSDESTRTRFNKCLLSHGFTGYVALEDFNNTNHIQYIYWGN